MEYSDNSANSTWDGSHGEASVHTFASKAEGKARELREAARSQAAQRVHQLGTKAQDRIDAERDRVASRIQDAAQRVRMRGDAAGPIGHTAGDQVATRLEAAAGYLHEHPSDEIAGDVATYVKQHPLRAVVAAAVVGYLFGRLAA
jgi:ElaB/YqjD/DUF883 family membrane-anchored ribosome-binding protein